MNALPAHPRSASSIQPMADPAAPAAPPPPPTAPSATAGAATRPCKTSHRSFQQGNLPQTSVLRKDDRSTNERTSCIKLKDTGGGKLRERKGFVDSWKKDTRKGREMNMSQEL